MYASAVRPFYNGVIMMASADSKFLFYLLTQKYISQFSSKTIKKLSTFTFFFIPAFLLNHSVCVAFNIVNTESFPGGTYNHFVQVNNEGRVLQESYFNFRNDTGITANDFHLTFNRSGDKGVLLSNEYTYPNGGPLDGTFPTGFFSIPSGAYFTPSSFRFVPGSPFYQSFLTDVYWTLNGKPLGNPSVPPIIVEPSISGINSFCTEEYLPNGACDFGTLGDVPIAVPEPLNILGAGVALGFGVTFKRKLAKNFKK